MNFKWPPISSRPAISAWLAATGVIAIVFFAVWAVMSASPPQGKQPTYIAKVQYSKTSESTSYNYGNILKDGLVITGVSVAISVCGAETLGACVAAVPGINAILGPVLNDKVEAVTADVTLYNVGNGTAKNLSFTATILSDGTPISSASYIAGDLPPRQQTTVQLNYIVTVADVPASLWNSFQGKGIITFQVSNIGYGSARP